MKIKGKIVEFYSYRKARMTVDYIRTEVTLSNEDTLDLNKWLERQGYRFDNHIAWKTDADVYYNYSDGILYIGNGLTIGDY